MAYCKKCGAYIPIGDTACPACGYDPEEEARLAREAKEKAAEEERRKKDAEKKARQERERQEEQRKKWSQDPRQSQGYGGGAAQAQYASQRTDQNATQSHSASGRTGWAPPWQETQNHGSASQSQSYYAAHNQARAQDSAAHQGLSVLSYLGFLFLIPLLTRPNDDFARYHANQGLILFLFNGLLSLLTGSGMLAAAGGLFSLYCCIKGISNVLKGKKEPLPLIGKLRLLK